MSPNPAETEAVTPWLAELSATGRDLVEIAKPRITTMVVFTTAIGVWLAPGSIGTARTALLFLGTAMLVASANMLNCWYERDTDALMLRTRLRPIPAGRLDAWSGFAAGIALGVFSIPILALAVNPLTALLGAIAHTTYVWAYTPLKRVTPLALEVGAIPGAIPPLMGWTAGTGALAVPGWFLFGLLFFWQLPHFLAIGWRHRVDYGEAGFRILPTLDPTGARTSRQALLFTLALLPVSLAPTWLGAAGSVYAAGALVLTLLFLAAAARFWKTTTDAAALQLFLVSIAWLPAVLFLFVVDRVAG